MEDSGFCGAGWVDCSDVMCLGLCLLGADVVNETAKCRDVFEICRDQVALCRLIIGIIIA